MLSLPTTLAATLAAGLLLATVGVSAAYADGQPVSSSVLGGTLSATVAGATLSTVTLNGGTTATSTGDSTQWSLIDARGTGAAWGLTVSGTDFTSLPGTTDVTARTLPITDLTITPGAITAGTGSDTAPTGTPVAVGTATSQTLITSTGNSKGTFTLTPAFSLSIPANAYRSNFTTGSSGAVNPYIATLTFTIS